ncbi:MAG TPA: transglycosylase SLT domain-containing protein [Terriglobia bacterium]|nr:transglycosylase SLT domain-containing protein [Terriglobia bacterium]
MILAFVIFLMLAMTGITGYLMLHGDVVDLRVKRARKVAARVLAQTSLGEEERDRYAVAIARNCVAKGLNPAVVAAIVVVESGGNSLAVAPSGDLGLMQVNVRIHSRVFNFAERNLLNPEQNIAVGTSILQGMVARHGDEKAIAAYNGLLPEKQDYTARVQAVLGRAGINPQSEPVEWKPSWGEVFSDWIGALASRWARGEEG